MLENLKRTSMDFVFDCSCTETWIKLLCREVVVLIPGILYRDLKKVSVLVLVGVLRVRREAVEHRHPVGNTFQSVGTATPLVGNGFLVKNGQVVRAYLLRLFSKRVQQRISEVASRRGGVGPVRGSGSTICGLQGTFWVRPRVS